MINFNNFNNLNNEMRGFRKFDLHHGGQEGFSGGSSVEVDKTEEERGEENLIEDEIKAMENALRESEAEKERLDKAGFGSEKLVHSSENIVGLNNEVIAQQLRDAIREITERGV